MNKRELQNFSVWAKENLETQIKVSLNLLGIFSETNIKRAFIKGDVTVIEGESKTYPKNFKGKRDSIVRLIKEEGFENTIERFAYTWFNRLIALRFMEVHGYLDHGFKIFPDGGIIEPEILSNLNFVKDELSLDVDQYTKLKNEDKIEELYRYVLFKQCNHLSKILPMLFSDEYDYLELLLPSVLLTGETIITKLVELNKEDFLNDIEVIGWLYQFYISVKRDEVFASKKKITKDTLPAVTQLFTPAWIVKYMAENSIGRIWLESYPNSPLKDEMKYYVEEAEQTEEVKLKLEEIRYKNVNPEEIKIIEPAAGSGHILVYAFELLFKMYEEKGYLKNDIPSLILKNNLVGLDVDKRASQLAQFALMMKARSIDRRFFNKDRIVIPKVLEIKDSKKLFELDYKNSLKELINNDWKNNENNLTDNDLKVIEYVVNTFKDAKVIGSLLKIKESNAYLIVGNKINKLRKTTVGGVFTNEFVLYGLKRISELLRLAHFMSNKYDVMITNPPYVGISLFEDPIKKYANQYYPNSKTDMFAMFMEIDLIKENGLLAMINMHSWMFLKSYELLRNKIINKKTIINMMHLGARAFDSIGGEVVQTVAFIFKNTVLKNYDASFIRLINSEEKEYDFLNNKNKVLHIYSNAKFKKIPGYVIGYWASDNLINNFENNQRINTMSINTGSQNITSDNSKYLRFFWEIKNFDVGKDKKWVFYAKGGEYRKYYGNINLVVKWDEESRNFYKTNKTSNLLNPDLWYEEGITYTLITSKGPNFRYLPKDNIFDKGGPSIVKIENNLVYYLLGLLNSKIAEYYFRVLNPTLNLQVNDVNQLPIIVEQNTVEIKKMVENNINISKNDWDSFETSWDFLRHPLVKGNNLLNVWNEYDQLTKTNFNQLKSNEEELNEYFINLYGLEDELTKEVEDKNVSISLADKERDIRSLISYLIGVLMGRYSLVEEGLIYAGGEFDNTRYGNFELDSDGIIPIYSKLGMEDNLTNKIIKLIKQIYGDDTYKENIDFIAESLGKRQNETSEETLNRYLNNDFYNDHIKIYQKRPIYWMFSSGKDNGFKVLVYLHRYSENTLAMINSNYLLPETTRLRNELNDIDISIKAADNVTKRRLEREKDLINKQYHEAVEYGYVLDHMANRYIKLDLDDGVKVNYMKFQGIEVVSDSGTKIKKDLLVPFKL